MQTACCKVILLAAAAALLAAEARAGRRTNFLTRSPSPAVSACGDSGTAGPARDTASAFHNPALLAGIGAASADLSYNPLTDGSYAGYAGAGLAAGPGYIAVSAVELASGDIEIRRNIDDDPEISRAVQRAFTCAFAFGRGKISAGAAVRYMDMKLYRYGGSAVGADAGLLFRTGGPQMPAGRSELSAGVSVVNALSPEITLISKKESYPQSLRAGAAWTVPAARRLEGRDTVTVKFDFKSEDGTAEPSGGAEYEIAGTLRLRAGYYPNSICAGIGITAGGVTFDYAAVSNEFALLSRFGISFMFGTKAKRTGDYLMKEAGKALADRTAEKKRERTAAGPEFRKALRHFDRGELLYATEILEGLMAEHPGFEGPSDLYGKIKAVIANDLSDDISDIARYSYARGYAAWYSADPGKAVSEWEKCTMFRKPSEEITEFTRRAIETLEDAKTAAREKRLQAEAEGILKNAAALRDEGRPVAAVKEFEKAREFCRTNRFAGAADATARASEEIRRIIEGISVSVREGKTAERPPARRPDIDERSAEMKYMEGLVCYARGRTFEAVNCWETALRFNPDHERAKKAIGKVKRCE